MNEAAVHLLWALLRTSAVLTVSALMLSAFLRVCRVSSPTVRRTAYFAILVQGCFFVNWPVEVPLPGLVTAIADHATRNGPGKLLRDRVFQKQEDRLFQNGFFENNSLDESRGRGTRPARAAKPEPAESPVLNDVARVAVESDAAKTLDVGDTALVVPATSQSTRPTPLPWALGLAVLWAAGIVVLIGRSLWTYFRFVRHLPPLQDIEPEWADEWHALQRAAGLRRLVPLAVAERAGPMLCRLPRGYRLIVPALAWRTLESSQRLLVLRHELAHLKRRDVWKTLGMRLLALPHWFNPLVWRIVGQFDECAEWACDEAAGRAAPEHVPDYARALLQLVHRAQPVFFATRAARERGLSHRIRRLLTPATEKGAKMKKAMLATLVVVITLVSVTRLRLRGNDNPPPLPPVSAIAFRDVPPPLADVVAQTPQTHRHTVTIQVPHTTIEMVPRARIEMVPVTKTEMVPETRIVDVVEPAAPAASLVPIADPLGVTIPAKAWAPANGPTSPQSAASPDWAPATSPAAAPRLAKIDLQYVLRGMQQYQRESARISTELENLKKARQAARARMLTAAQARMKQEQDPVMKEVIDKGMTEKLKEMMQEENVDVGNRSSELTQRMLHRIVDEVAAYAKEHHILVVRRERRASSHEGERFERKQERFGPAPLLGSAGLLNSPDSPSGPGASSPGDPYESLAPGRRDQLWNNDVIYSAERLGPKEIDISDDIVERLNKADDAAKGAQKGPDFTFDIGVTR